MVAVDEATPLTNMTDEDIEEMGTQALRDYIVGYELEDEFQTREIVFEVTLTARVFESTGTLTEIDKMLATLRTGPYRTEDTKIVYSYNRVAMTTWAADVRLKAYLKVQRARLFREEADEIANRDHNGWTSPG